MRKLTYFDTVLEGRASYEIGLKVGVPDEMPTRISGITCSPAATPRTKSTSYPSNCTPLSPGPGCRYSPGNSRRNERFTLTEQRTFDSGVLFLTYTKT